MAFEQPEMTMGLFKNKKYVVGGTYPYLDGIAKINGVEYRVALWVPKEGKTNYFGKFTLKDGQRQPEVKKEIGEWPKDDPTQIPVKQEELPLAPPDRSGLFR